MSFISRENFRRKFIEQTRISIENKLLIIAWDPIRQTENMEILSVRFIVYGIHCHGGIHGYVEDNGITADITWTVYCCASIELQTIEKQNELKSKDGEEDETFEFRNSLLAWVEIQNASVKLKGVHWKHHKHRSFENNSNIRVLKYMQRQYANFCRSMSLQFAAICCVCLTPQFSLFVLFDVRRVCNSIIQCSNFERSMLKIQLSLKKKTNVEMYLFKLFRLALHRVTSRSMNAGNIAHWPRP